MTEENSKEERGVKYGTRPGTGQLAVPWHPSASAGRTRWPNPELRCFDVARDPGPACAGATVSVMNIKHAMCHTCLRTHYFSEVFSTPMV
jgi:hypothetical protein